MKIHFLNYSHSGGDIHCSLEYMKDLYHLIQPEECYLHHFTNPLLIVDVPYIKSTPPLLIKNTPVIFNPPYNKEGRTPCDFIDFPGMKPGYDYLYQNASTDDDVYIVTWIGYYWFGPIPTPIYGVCCFESYYNAFKTIYDELGILEHLKPLEYYLPTRDYSYINREPVDTFVSEHPGKKVLISNGEVLSGQAENFDFTGIVNMLAKKHPGVTFILSQKCLLTLPNVHFTSDITKVSGCDLVEISYLSSKCNLLVGRSSGPISVMTTKENYFDKNKTFITINERRLEGLVYEVPEGIGCKQIWSNNYNLGNVFDIIDKEI